MKIIKSVFIVLAILNSVSACKKSDDESTTNDPPSENEVQIQNMAFNPATITVAINTTVKWINKDGAAHTVTSTTGLFDSGNINHEGTFSHLFATSGTYPYKCSLHSGVTGTVIVQ